MKATLALIALCFASSSYALDLNGKLAASDGQATDQKDWNSACEIFEVEMAQTPSMIEVKSGSFHCGELTLDWSPFQTEVRGNGLYYQGQKVGTVSDSELHAVYTDPSLHLTTKYDFVGGGNSYIFRYQIHSPQDEYTFTGTLQKAN